MQETHGVLSEYPITGEAVTSVYGQQGVCIYTRMEYGLPVSYVKCEDFGEPRAIHARLLTLEVDEDEKDDA